MSFTLRVRLKKAEGSLVRLLGQIGRRGYDVVSLIVRPAAGGASFDVAVEFVPFLPAPPAPPLPRPPELIVGLVRKLWDVESADLVAPDGAGTAGEG